MQLSSMVFHVTHRVIEFGAFLSLQTVIIIHSFLQMIVARPLPNVQLPICDF